MRVWSLYMLLCGDGTIYTGISVDPDHRLRMHRIGKGAKYTKTRSPLIMIHTEVVGTQSEALKREHQVKKLSHAEKLKLARRLHF